MKRTLVLFAFVLVACGGGGGEKVAYRPVAFGADSQCYYADDPLEVQMLVNAGLCEPHWSPAAMPLAWHQRYWNYYSSPAYYQLYVPEPIRTVYVDRERSFGSLNRQAIATESKKATYRGSNGKTVSADKIGAAKYGGGNRFGPVGKKFGGGARDATPGTAKVSPTRTHTTPPATARPSPPKVQKPKSSPPKSGSKPSSGVKSGGSKSYGGGKR
jgi:hypothetical protein